MIHGIDAAGPRFCPACGAEGSLRKAFALPAVHFKGSGWAKKDRSTARTKAAAKSDGAADSGAKGGSSGDSSSTATTAADSTTTATSSSGSSSGSDGGDGSAASRPAKD